MTGLAALATQRGRATLELDGAVLRVPVSGALGVAGSAVRAGSQGARFSRTIRGGRAHGRASAHASGISAAKLTSTSGVRTPSRLSRAWKSKTRIPSAARRKFSARFRRRSGTSNSVVERELNASTDNPLVFPETQSIIHCGNFYGQQIAMACDYLRHRPRQMRAAAGTPARTARELALQPRPAAAAFRRRSRLELRFHGRRNCSPRRSPPNAGC